MFYFFFYVDLQSVIHIPYIPSVRLVFWRPGILSASAFFYLLAHEDDR